MVLEFGFMEDLNVPRTLANARLDDLGFFYEPLSTSHFLSRDIVLPTGRSALPHWRARLFALMSRGSTSAADYFGLPVNRVLELGAQVEM